MTFLHLLFVTMGILLSVRGETKMPDGQTVHEYVEHMGLSKDKYEKLCEKTKEYRKKEMEVLGTKYDDDDISVPIEGDFILNEYMLEYKMDQLKKMEEGHSRVKRTAFINPHSTFKFHSELSNPSIKWDKKTFKYSFYNIDSKRQDIIVRALNEIEQKTCLRFKQTLAPQSDMLFANKYGCSSSVGDDTTISNAQIIFLTHDCIDGYGAVLHEVGHFLGMNHEQSRPDRDKYVEVTRTDKKPVLDLNYMRRDEEEINTQGYPYDYQSIMHYPKYTADHIIDPENMIYDTTIGQRSELSFYDAAAINDYYCSFCDTSDDCDNEGYRVISDLRCDQDCVCPDGLAGELCDKGIACGHEGCRPGERVLFANYGETTCLTSPGYDDDGYHPGDQCSWLILDGDCHDHHCHIKVWFKDAFDVKSNYDVCDHWVEVRLNGKTKQGQRFCGGDKAKLKFPSIEKSNTFEDYGEGATGSMLVNFRSFPEADGSRGNHKYQGFKLCFTFMRS